MQTNFSLVQLADPNTAESNQILRACVHCGFCNATCPTYVLLGDELDSPRGRIYLIKDMLESGRPATREVVKHIDRCLSCFACMTTCPSGVHYMHLVDHARVHIEKTYRRPLFDKLLRAFLAKVLPDPKLFRRALYAGWLARRFVALFAALGMKPLVAMLQLAPARRPPDLVPEGRQVHAAIGPRKGRVILLTGCANDLLRPEINAATIRLLTRHGIEVVVAAGQGCCGSLVYHMGREHQALTQAKANVDVWLAEAGEGLDAIVINASGCGTTVKDYGFMLRSEPGYARRAAWISARAQDICEYLATLGLPGPAESRPLVVAYQAACSLQHGQRIVREPKELLSKFGFVVKDIPEGHLCCGSAGTYNIFHADIARRLRDRKIERIEQVKPDVIAAGNIGCITQIETGTAIPVVHPVELIDWATGGPRPAEMRQGDRQAPGESPMKAKAALETAKS